MIHEGEILNGTYQVMKQIGRGGSGLVFLAYHRNLRKYVVIKRVQSGLGNLETLRAETDILKNLRHTNIPNVYDFLVRDGEVFTVMDYIEGTSFEKLPAGGRRISEKSLTGMMTQLADVLSYLHKNKPPVIHSDIKPDNLILNREGLVCLIDFNISVSSNVASSLSGYSMHFASPEQWQRVMQMRTGNRKLPPLDARTDIYSTGALFYYLITGCYPDTRRPRIPGNTGFSANSAGNSAGGAFPASVLYQDMVSCGYSEAFCRIIARCLEQNRNLRYADGTRLRKALRHVRRQDRRFQRYILLRAGSWILTAALIGGGVWFLSKGLRQQTADNYVAAYQRFVTAQNSGEEQAVWDAGKEILNNSEYSQIRKERPQDQAQIQQCLGDYAYEQKSYETALEYYEKALETAKSAGLPTSRYYRDYAITLAMDEQPRKAQIILDEAKAAQGSDGNDAGSLDPNLMLVQAYILLQEDKAPDCIAEVKEILRTRSDADVKARACVLAADACGSLDKYGSSYYYGNSNDGALSSDGSLNEKGSGAAEGKTDAVQLTEEERDRLHWLKRATEYSSEPKYQRLLAEEYWKRAGDSEKKSPEEQEEYAKQALACYERLAERPLARADDCINRAMILQNLNRFDESLNILKALESRWPEDFRIPMYMAFAYDAKGELGSASSCARKALEMYEKSGNTSMAYNEELEYLQQLK
jgi:serine/threonine protein kinase